MGQRRIPASGKPGGATTHGTRRDASRPGRPDGPDPRGYRSPGAGHAPTQIPVMALMYRAPQRSDGTTS